MRTLQTQELTLHVSRYTLPPPQLDTHLNLFSSSHYITQISSARKQKQTVKDSAPISNAVPGNFISPSAFVGAPMTPASASGNNAIAFGSPITPAAGNGTPSQIRGSAGMGLGIGLGVGADGGEPQSSIRKSNGDAAGSSRPSKRQKSKSVHSIPSGIGVLYADDFSLISAFPALDQPQPAASNHSPHHHHLTTRKSVSTSSSISSPLNSSAVMRSVTQIYWNPT